METFYHGSDERFETLNANSYIAPDLETARGYGRYLYEVSVTPDRPEVKGRFLTGKTIRGTCTEIKVQSVEGFQYAITHVTLPVRMVARD